MHPNVSKNSMWYALNLVVLDNTGETNFLLFKNVAEELIGQPCSALIGGNIDEIQGCALPAVLTELVGKTTIFKITTENKNYRYNHATFKVLKIITSSDMINELAVNHCPLGSTSKLRGSYNHLLDPIFVLTYLKFWR
ncbi:hypothetical protein F2Q69_00029884 [Brassica cretica]|uniref:Replication factor A C-terminal domain-containing protein n=1 Tax=Brassica cretica TaxID=69181 RepID=A0A8S9RWG3_BRACR|nr:hypothetical protein F2Q69_00029884 [Brassica cretica]